MITDCTPLDYRRLIEKTLEENGCRRASIYYDERNSDEGGVFHIEIFGRGISDVVDVRDFRTQLKKLVEEKKDSLAEGMPRKL